MSRLEAILDVCEDERVLDVGCYGDRTAYGHPEWLHGHIRDVASDVRGIDVNESGVQTLQEDGFDVSLADAQEFELGERYDVVVAAEVIEHLHSPGCFLDRAREHLADDGKLVLTTPNLHSLFVLGAYLLPGYHEEAHTLGFTPSLLSNLLTRCGFEIEELRRTSHEDVPSHGNRLVNLLVPRSLAFTIFCVARPVVSGPGDT